MPKTGAIIVAAGSSQRMGGTDKLLTVVAGRPLISHTLDAFLACAELDEIVVVASPANKSDIEAAACAAGPRLAGVVLGGERRRDSVRAGLNVLLDCDDVVVHDGARPLVTPDLITAALDGARETGAALCSAAVADTVKRADEKGLVRTTVSRDHLYLAQTPQAFRRELLLRAHDEVRGDMTDDAAMIEHLHQPVRLVQGSRTNVKVTTPEDLALVEALLLSR